MTIADSPAHSVITITADDGFPIPGTFARRTGGNRTSTERRYREGGQLKREEVGGGPATTENQTYSRPYKRDRDIAILRWAHRVAGGMLLTIVEQPIDDDENPFGDPIVDRARLLGCNRPDIDADDTSGLKNIELTVAPFGELG